MILVIEKSQKRALYLSIFDRPQMRVIQWFKVAVRTDMVTNYPEVRSALLVSPCHILLEMGAPCANCTYYQSLVVITLTRESS